jgi:hypothetical protein
MSFEIEGRLLKIFATEQKSGTFQTREFVLEIASGNYPQVIKFQLTQDKCAVLDGRNEGDAVKVYFDLRGREWNGKYLTNLNAWKIDNGSAEGAPAQASSSGFATSAPVRAAAPAVTEFPTVDDVPPMPMSDDLPF